jgi:glucosylceramidase
MVVMIAVCMPAVLHAGDAASSSHPAVQWKCSTEAHPWVDQPSPAILSADPDPQGLMIEVDSTRQFQQIDGWGGCFNERGWKAMEILSDTDRAALLKNLFDAKDGLNLNLCRTPIGSSDYAISLYSLDETPGDFSMQHFSIERDRQRLIPFIKSAMALRPDLKLWAVPWSPPAWMKDSNKLDGGKIKDDDQTFDALALYFVKYVQAYRAEGIPLFMVMPQNEPTYSTNYSSCEWTGKQLGAFIGKHLGPAFKANKLDCEIYLGTLARTEPQNYLFEVAPTVDDPVARSYISGIGFQWDGIQLMRDTRFLHPEIKVMQTENECGEKNTNDWAFAVHQFDRAVAYFNAGASSSMIWNMVLDQTGLSTGNWPQCSPVVVDQNTKKIIYTPYYYCYRHFSSFIQPGAHRVAVEGRWANKLAFVNPDGTIVIVLANTSDKDDPLTMLVDGRIIKATLAAKSFNTFTIPGKG